MPYLTWYVPPWSSDSSTLRMTSRIALTDALMCISREPGESQQAHLCASSSAPCVAASAEDTNGGGGGGEVDFDSTVIFAPPTRRDAQRVTQIMVIARQV